MKLLIRWMSQNVFNGKPVLSYVIAWCRQDISQYLSKYWPKSMLPFGLDIRKRNVGNAYLILNFLDDILHAFVAIVKLNGKLCTLMGYHWYMFILCTRLDLSLFWCYHFNERLNVIITNADLLSIRPLGTNFSEIQIKIQNFSLMKIYLKMSPAKWRPFCLGEDELNNSPWPKGSVQISTIQLFRFHYSGSTLNQSLKKHLEYRKENPPADYNKSNQL